MNEPAGIPARPVAASAPGAAQSPAVLEDLSEDFSAAHLTRARMTLTLGALSLVVLLSMIVAAAFGSVHINLVRALIEPRSPDHAIFFSARLPRVLMGAAVGAALAAVGAALQALVRNPLAEGGILGISGGGAFGAIVALVFVAGRTGAVATVPLCAFGAARWSTAASSRSRCCWSA
jgi:ABC-type Fe3+-siderophore transport system permease subunit